jgi:hypothetical protein
MARADISILKFVCAKQNKSFPLGNHNCGKILSPQLYNLFNGKKNYYSLNEFLIIFSVKLLPNFFLVIK